MALNVASYDVHLLPDPNCTMLGEILALSVLKLRAPSLQHETLYPVAVLLSCTEVKIGNKLQC